MGGGYALALAPGRGFAASSSNYGGCPKDAERLLAGACPIVASYGGKDRSPMGYRAADRLERALTANGVDHDIKVYPDAGHGFLNKHPPRGHDARDGGPEQDLRDPLSRALRSGCAPTHHRLLRPAPEVVKPAGSGLAAPDQAGGDRRPAGSNQLDQLIASAAARLGLAVGKAPRARRCR